MKAMRARLLSSVRRFLIALFVFLMSLRLRILQGVEANTPITRAKERSVYRLRFVKLPFLLQNTYIKSLLAFLSLYFRSHIQQVSRARHCVATTLPDPHDRFRRTCICQRHWLNISATYFSTTTSTLDVRAHNSSAFAVREALLSVLGRGIHHRQWDHDKSGKRWLLF